MNLRRHKLLRSRQWANSTVPYCGFRTYVWSLYTSRPLPRK